MIVASWLLYLVCTALSTAFMNWNHTASVITLITGHFLLLLFHHAAFYQIFSSSTTRVLLTNRRILSYSQHLWQHDHFVDIPLWRVRALEVKKSSVIQHLLDYGSIILNRGELPSLQRIPHPQTLHAQIVSQMQEIQKSLERQPQPSVVP